jgi:hypothetical protein
MQEKIIAAIPQGREDIVLEVALIQDERTGISIELRSLTWSADVGWYRQQTLKLDRTAARALLRTLGYVRGHLGSEPCDMQATKVIPWPGTDRAKAVMQQHARQF